MRNERDLTCVKRVGNIKHSLGSQVQPQELQVWCALAGPLTQPQVNRQRYKTFIQIYKGKKVKCTWQLSNSLCFLCAPQSFLISQPKLQEWISEEQSVHSSPFKALVGGTLLLFILNVQHASKSTSHAGANQKPVISCSYYVTQDGLPLERSWNLSLVFFFLHFQGLNSFPRDDSLPLCCRDAWAFWVLVALSTTTSQLASDDDFSNPSTARHTWRKEKMWHYKSWYKLHTQARSTDLYMDQWVNVYSYMEIIHFLVIYL